MANQQNNKLLLTLAATAIIILGAGYMFIGASDSPGTHTAAGSAANSGDEQDQYQVAPDFTLTDLDGKEVALSDYKDKVVFLNFWATWCGPCRMEIPHFIDLVEQYGGDGFAIIGVALDPREFEKVPGFTEQMGINYTVVLDKKGVSNLYGGIRSIPTTFVINREGKVVDQIVGSRSKAEFESLIKKWL